MATEINKNKKWTNKSDIKKRRKKIKDINDKSSMNILVNSFIAAVKIKHS